MMPVTTNLKRRDFIKVTCLSGMGLLIGFRLNASDTHKEVTAEEIELNAFIKITTDDRIIIMAKNPEIGQGVMTSFPMIIAEELCVDWKKVQVEQAPYDIKFGDQWAGGSSAIRNNMEMLQKAGAVAREILLEIAAKRWNVSLDDCYAKDGFIYRKNTNEKFNYGSLVDQNTRWVIRPDFPRLKDPNEYNIIGTSVSGVDNLRIVNGTAQFGIDAHIEGMVYCAIERCPVFGGDIKNFSASDALHIPGVLGVHEIKYKHASYYISGVAVVAKNVWSAMKGKSALQPEWNFNGGEIESDDTIRKKSEKNLAGGAGYIGRQSGDVEKALAGSVKSHEAVYEIPYLAHLTMEPMNYTAHVKTDGIELIGPTQSPTYLREQVSIATGVPIEKIKLTLTRSGGGFGRRLEVDYAIEAALISQKIGKPVQVIWTREDDIAHDFYNPFALCRIKAGLNENNMLVAWDVVSSYHLPSDSFPAPFVANVRVNPSQIDSKIPVGAWRAPGHNICAFFYETFLDELAEKAGKDPVDMRLELLGEGDKLYALNSYGNKYFSTGRMKRVITTVADVSKWRHAKPPGVYQGFAAHFFFGTYVAEVFTIKKEASGAWRIEEVNAVVDCGRVINVSGAKAQLEGGIMDGISVALYGGVHIAEGRIVPGNFDRYKLSRIKDAPRVINISFIDNDEKPMGLGEVGLPPAIPAFCNAYSKAFKTRVRKLPIQS